MASSSCLRTEYVKVPSEGGCEVTPPPKIPKLTFSDCSPGFVCLPKVDGVELLNYLQASARWFDDNADCLRSTPTSGKE
jgi:hypothetical protein